MLVHEGVEKRHPPFTNVHLLPQHHRAVLDHDELLTSRLLAFQTDRVFSVLIETPLAVPFQQRTLQRTGVPLRLSPSWAYGVWDMGIWLYNTSTRQPLVFNGFGLQRETILQQCFHGYRYCNDTAVASSAKMSDYGIP